MKRTPLKRKTRLKTSTPRFIAFAVELEEVRPLVVARAAGLCECCGAKPGVVLHHKLRRSAGGTNKMSNLMLLAESCHRYIHEHPSESYKMGWLIRRKR